MGIAKGAVSLLFELRKTEKFSGTVCQLGRQTTFVTSIDVVKIALAFGIDISDYIFDETSFKLNQLMISDIDLFKCLGFETVESMDYSNFENSTHVLDLNNPIPREFYEKYDAIYDGGTLEHIFNFPQCLKNIHLMLKPGGIIIHASPSHNHVDHGFYMFSPTVFYDYYKTNQYDIIRSFIFEYEAEHDKKPWIIYDYTPGSIDFLAYGGWGDKLLGIWSVSKKVLNSSCDKIPQQSFYLRAWESSNNSKANLEKKKRNAVVSKLISIAKSNKYIFKAILFILTINKKPALMRPEIIARY